MARLSTAISTAMAAAVVGTPSGAIYSTNTPASLTWVRNTSAWFASTGVDLSCISPYNNKTGHNCGCTMVHPIIGVTAYHYLGSSSGDWVGTAFYFVHPSTDATVTRLVTAVSRVGTTDILLLKFSSAVTSGGIGYAKVLPSDWHDYLPKLRQDQATPTMGIPAVHTNKNEALAIDYWIGWKDTGLFDDGTGQSECYTRSYTDTDMLGEFYRPTGYNSAFAPYTYTSTTGDSGHTGMSLIIGSSLVVLCAIYGGVADGPFLTKHATATNSAMDGLFTGAALTAVDLSAYSKNFQNPATRMRVA